MIRPTMILITLLASSLGLTLFVVKYQVQDLESVLVGYNNKIIEDQEAIHVLKAEWSHLNQPSRLRKLAKRHLGMDLVQPEQVGTAQEIFSGAIPSIVILDSNIGANNEQLVIPLKVQSYITEAKE